MGAVAHTAPEMGAAGTNWTLTPVALRGESKTAFFSILQSQKQRRLSALGVGAGGGGAVHDLHRNHFLATGFPKEKGTGSLWVFQHTAPGPPASRCGPP